MRQEDPSPYTPEGRIEQARRFGMGWRNAARWKKRGFLLTPVIVIALMGVAFILYLLLTSIQNFFR